MDFKHQCYLKCVEEYMLKRQKIMKNTINKALFPGQMRLTRVERGLLDVRHTQSVKR